MDRLQKGLLITQMRYMAQMQLTHRLFPPFFLAGTVDWGGRPLVPGEKASGALTLRVGCKSNYRNHELRLITLAIPYPTVFKRVRSRR